MRSQIEGVILTLLLVATPTTLSEATAATSHVIRIRTGSSRKTTLKPNAGKSVKPNLMKRPMPPPPKERDFRRIPPGARYVPGVLLVSFALQPDGTLPTISERGQIIRRLGGGILKRTYRFLPALSVVVLPPSLTVRRALVIYNRSREIAYAEPNYRIRIPESPEPKPVP
ncbi:MAG: S8 family serine peptidase, partial [Planctomycetota bacterium]